MPVKLLVAGSKVRPVRLSGKKTYMKKLQTEAGRKVGWQEDEYVLCYAQDPAITKFFQDRVAEARSTMMKFLEENPSLGIDTTRLPTLDFEKLKFPDKLKESLIFYVVDGMHRTAAMKTLYELTTDPKYRYVILSDCTYTNIHFNRDSCLSASFP